MRPEQDSARTLIPFLGDPGPGSWTPDVAVVTPPNETRSTTLPWTFGPVARQDGATHPGTFIHAVTGS